jgi:lysophospholipase L1-like esterase
MIKKSFLAIFATLALSQQAFSASPPNPMQTWIIMGDSIMSAVSPAKVDGPSGLSSHMTANLLMNEKNISIRNISSPGNSIGHSDSTGFGNTASVTQSLDRIAGFFSFYNGIIIQAGTNDYGRSVSLSTFNKSLEGILSYAKARNKKVLLMEPIWRRNEGVKNKEGLVLSDYSKAMQSLCYKYNTICHFAERKNSKLATINSSGYFDANEVKAKGELHLNAFGHRAYADWIKLEAAKKKWF